MVQRATVVASLLLCCIFLCLQAHTTVATTNIPPVTHDLTPNEDTIPTDLDVSSKGPEWPQRVLYVKTGFAPIPETGEGGKSYTFVMPSNLPSGLVVRASASSFEIQDSFLPPDGISYDGLGSMGSGGILSSRVTIPISEAAKEAHRKEQEEGRELSLAEILAMVGEANAAKEAEEDPAAVADEDLSPNPNAEKEQEEEPEAPMAALDADVDEASDVGDQDQEQEKDVEEQEKDEEELALMPAARDWMCVEVASEREEAEGGWVVRSCKDHPVLKSSVELQTDPEANPMVPGEGYTVSVECGKECQFSAVEFIALVEFDLLI